MTLADLDDLRRVLKLVFGDELPPRSLNLVEAVALVREGSQTSQEAARLVRTTPAVVSNAISAESPFRAILGVDVSTPPSERDTRIRSNLGQLIIGNLAERVFEELYRTSVGTSELELRDDRRVRGDTDFLVFNGSGRQVFRLNIKFHGSQFRRARELVGLDPEDCFALATYKIYAALQRQQTEHLPYIFVIVGVPGLTGAAVGESVPPDLVHLLHLADTSPRVSGKRRIEDRIVERLTSDPEAFGFESAAASYTEDIGQAKWFVLSARRANNLLREKLFERAYALRVRGFTRNYPGAELDMHFSLAEDLTPLSEVFNVLRDHGMMGLGSRLERGTL